MPALPRRARAVRPWARRVAGLVLSARPGYQLAVPLFSRIFNFEQAKVSQMEQRLNNRYTPGAAFPLQAWLVTGSNEWSAQVRDISGNGIALLVDAAARPAAGTPARVRLAVGDYQQAIPARIIQVRESGRSSLCGIGLQFEDFPALKSYLQLLQPIAIGQSLQPVAAERVVQNEPQFTKLIFRGEEGSVLTVWLQKTAGTPLHSFEFEMQDYFCRAVAGAGQLEAYTLEADNSHKGKFKTPVRDSSGELEAEIRQLFRWILPNLAPSVPQDVRGFLQNFAG